LLIHEPEGTQAEDADDRHGQQPPTDLTPHAIPVPSARVASIVALEGWR
jgi:hypothetical protein